MTGKLDSTARRKIISRIETLVLKRAFNIGNIDLKEWCRNVNEQTSALLEAENDSAFEQASTIFWVSLNRAIWIFTGPTEIRSARSTPLARISDQSMSSTRRGGCFWTYSRIARPPAPA